MTWQSSRAASGCQSLAEGLFSIGINGHAQRPFINEYHNFASNCRARNPLVRPTIGQYLRRVEANGLKPLLDNPLRENQNEEDDPEGN